MKRVIMLVAAFALLSAAPALAAKGGPLYKLDVKGKCHDSSGAMATQSLCAKPAATPRKPVAPAKPATPAKPVVATATKPTTTGTRGAPNCKPGNKPCGKICISASKTCHV
jgi:hypothetical protein